MIVRKVLVVALFFAVAACTHHTGGPAATATKVCPGQNAQWLAHATEADLIAKGAGDALPGPEATTLRSVQEAVRRNTAFLRSHVPGIVQVSVGPGIGWTWRATPTGPKYDHHPDFQVIARVATAAECPRAVWDVDNAAGQRVPVQFEFNA